MSSLFAVDVNGKRIKTDVLVFGWIRLLCKTYRLLMPNDITTICFDYWLIKVCDEWDRDFCVPDIAIEGASVMLTDNTSAITSVYGSHSLSSGSHEWMIRLKTKITWICIGIIEDTNEILLKYQRDNDYYKENGAFIINNGDHFSNSRWNWGYCEPFKEKGTIIVMTLNMNECTLTYKINDKEYGIAMRDIPKKSYRFVASLNLKGDAIEFL